MLPSVVRFNASRGENPYAAIESDAGRLLARLEGMRSSAGIAESLGSMGISEDDLPSLANEAAEQWTAQFNPVPVKTDALSGIFRAAW